MLFPTSEPKIAPQVQVLEPAGQVRRCRVRSTRRHEKQGDTLRVPFGVSHKLAQLEGALIKCFNQHGQRQHGPAPRGALERDAAKVPDQLQE